LRDVVANAPIIREQLQKAGVRLAHMLDAALGKEWARGVAKPREVFDRIQAIAPRISSEPLRGARYAPEGAASPTQAAQLSTIRSAAGFVVLADVL
jgi:hypothetical protein